MSCKYGCMCVLIFFLNIIFYYLFRVSHTYFEGRNPRLEFEEDCSPYELYSTGFRYFSWLYIKNIQNMRKKQVLKSLRCLGAIY